MTLGSPALLLAGEKDNNEGHGKAIIRKRPQRTCTALRFPTQRPVAGDKRAATVFSITHIHESYISAPCSRVVLLWSSRLLFS